MRNFPRSDEIIFMVIQKLLLIIPSLLMIFSCSGVNRDTAYNQESGNSIKIVRFDADFLNYLSSSEENRDSIIQEAYGFFLPYFSTVTVGSDEVDLSRLEKYFSHPQLQKLYKDTESVFADLSAVEEELTLAALTAKEKLNKSFPAFYAHVSGLKQNVIVTDSLISISLDKYLGSDYEMYATFFEPYQRVNMSAKYIARDYLKAWVLSEEMIDASHKDLLQAIVAEGKVLFLLQTLLPDLSPKELLGYSEKQMEWCTKNEKKIWRAMISRKHLYGTDALVISEYIGDAAYTAVLAPESAPRIGQFIGWQIVVKYMKNSKSDINGFLEASAEDILRISKYNP